MILEYTNQRKKKIIVEFEGIREREIKLPVFPRNSPYKRRKSEKKTQNWKDLVFFGKKEKKGTERDRNKEEKGINLRIYECSCINRCVSGVGRWGAG